ncbi:MAG: hypothetical protein AABY64_03220 [Bdellovibrionota bacterium]
MKKVFLSVFILGSQSFAGTRAAFTAVLSLAEVKNLAVIEKLELIKPLRCPECYEISVQGIKNLTDPTSTHLLVQTRMDTEKQEVVAKIIETK